MFLQVSYTYKLENTVINYQIPGSLFLKK